MENLKSYLKEKVKELYENGIYFYELHYELLGYNNVKGWPEVLLTSEDDEEIGDKDELDMENFEWLYINDDELEICCGGDWQSPMKLTIHLINNEFVVVNTEENYYENGLTEDEFDDLLEIK
jgi:hypothetical protein